MIFSADTGTLDLNRCGDRNKLTVVVIFRGDIAALRPFGSFNCDVPACGSNLVILNDGSPHTRSRDELIITYHVWCVCVWCFARPFWTNDTRPHTNTHSAHTTTTRDCITGLKIVIIAYTGKSGNTSLMEKGEKLT